MLSSRHVLTALFLASGTLAGCSAPSDEEITGAVDSELTLPAQVLGPIAPGETRADDYVGGASHRAFTFNATGGDKIIADVTLHGGDAHGYITDASFTVLAENDDANPETRDAKVTFTVPAGPTRSFRIVFRDNAAPSGSFRVRLAIHPGACNPPAEPWHTYLGNAEECKVLTWTCPVGERRFKNACGCGCERPN
jgi:hypothetical protein